MPLKFLTHACTLATILVMLAMTTSSLQAHDTWVESNAQVVRVGDAVFVDLKLGNHGNDHRDFKLASKLQIPDGCTLHVIMPNGIKFDLLGLLNDLGYAPNEGYWSGKFVTRYAGTYLVSHEFDRVVNHGKPSRSIKSAKTFFLAGLLLDKLKDDSDVWQKPIGHPLELVPVSHPVLFTGPGMPIEVQLLWKGQPLQNEIVSFIPQGTELKEGFDETYERRTDENGKVNFTPRTGNRYLIVSHLKKAEETGPNYESTSYSATLQLIIPEICPCCE